MQRPSARGARPARPCARWLLLVPFLALAGSRPPLVALPDARPMAAVRSVSADGDRKPDGALQGVEHDPVARFARGAARELRRVDADVFEERIRGLLPRYRNAFFEAQERSDIEWRLLAAIAYQESQWEPQATSETGVRGFMQLTEQTARHLGVADRLDARASILAAARYLKDLKARLPDRIVEPDRTWLALAAFNIGLGHLEDARVLAQRQKKNPDLWRDVKEALPMLAQPEHYETTKLGYARGGMPVAFVDRVRAFYDILLHHEAAHPPRADLASDRT